MLQGTVLDPPCPSAPPRQEQTSCHLPPGRNCALEMRERDKNDLSLPLPCTKEEVTSRCNLRKSSGHREMGSKQVEQDGLQSNCQALAQGHSETDLYVIICWGPTERGQKQNGRHTYSSLNPLDPRGIMWYIDLFWVKTLRASGRQTRKQMRMALVMGPSRHCCVSHWRQTTIGSIFPLLHFPAQHSFLDRWPVSGLSKG